MSLANDPTTTIRATTERIEPALIVGARLGPVLAIEEKSGRPFASTRPGLMQPDDGCIGLGVLALSRAALELLA